MGFPAKKAFSKVGKPVAKPKQPLPPALPSAQNRGGNMTASLNHSRAHRAKSGY